MPSILPPPITTTAWHWCTHTHIPTVLQYLINPGSCVINIFYPWISPPPALAPPPPPNTPAPPLPTDTHPHHQHCRCRCLHNPSHSQHWYHSCCIYIAMFFYYLCCRSTMLVDMVQNLTMTVNWKPGGK